MAVISTVLVLLLALFDTYIIFGVISGSPLIIKILFLMPSIAYLFVIFKMSFGGDLRQSTLNRLFWLTLCVFFPTLLFSVFSILGKCIGLFWHPGIQVLNIAGVIFALAWLCISLYGIIYGWKKVTVENVTISSQKIPESFNGYRIVQLSDFHIGTYHDSPASVKRIVEEVNSLNPDLIVFTGDLVNSSSAEIDEFKDLLSQLRARDGVYSVLGNHDYCLYRQYAAPDSPAKELAKVVAKERAVGWTILRNEAVRLTRGNDSIALVGVDNAGGKRFTDQSDLPKATQALRSNEFKILLSHDPSHWRREVLPKTDIDLTLSGHTHALQFKIGNWSPSEWTYPEWGGLYAESNHQLYVSAGIGENIAFRFGAWPQIVSITLLPESSVTDTVSS